MKSKETHHICDAIIPYIERGDLICYRCGTDENVKYKSMYQYGTFYLCEKCKSRDGSAFINGLHSEMMLLKNL